MPHSILRSRARVLTISTLRVLGGFALAGAVIAAGMRVGDVPHGPQTIDAGSLASHWRQAESVTASRDAAAEVRMAAIRLRDLRIERVRADRARRQRLEALRPKWMRPLDSAVVSPYGPRWGGFHPGIDFFANVGTPVHAAGDGYVISPPDGTSGYGNVVTIAHPDGSVTWYCHLSQVILTPGQAVHAGDVVGLSGATGAVTGPHLHFEVRFNNVTVDPIPWLRHHGVAI